MSQDIYETFVKAAHKFIHMCLLKLYKFVIYLRICISENLLGNFGTFHFFAAENEEMPGSYILTNKVRDVTNWAGANVTMPGINFTICFWVKIDSWHETRPGTTLSMATSGVVKCSKYLNL